MRNVQICMQNRVGVEIFTTLTLNSLTTIAGRLGFLVLQPTVLIPFHQPLALLLSLEKPQPKKRIIRRTAEHNLLVEGIIFIIYLLSLLLFTHRFFYLRIRVRVSNTYHILSLFSHSSQVFHKLQPVKVREGNLCPFS
jgi:hypothetical protein